VLVHMDFADSKPAGGCTGASESRRGAESPNQNSMEA